MNIINVNFKNRYSALVSESRYQYDYGQVLLFEGLDLPPAYEVHFSNREDLGESITQIGTPDGVPVPDEMFLSGKDIYAFTYLHKGSSDGRTMYKVKIPVKKRPKPTDQEITPVEQSALDQALAAFEQAAAPLPEAARKAEAAIHTYPKIIDGHWYVWDVDTEAFVDTGVESTGEQGVGIANIVHNDDHTLTITLTNGETYTTDPVKGDKGDKGDRGLTGNGIASTNLNSNYSLTITFTDGTTYTTPPIRGKEGKAGFSPQITVGAVGENRHIVTITDASGTKSFSIYDGAQGPKGDRGDPTDVQIDGTSIVEDGVANIPLTSSLRPGVVKTSNSIASLPDGAIGVVPASVDMLKSLSDNERAITSGRLHHGVFYGLAKASGDTTQSQSDNPVGNYTDEAKTAIQTMLNVPDKDDVSAIDFSDRIAKGVDSNDNVVDGALIIGQVEDGVDGNNNPVPKNIASGKYAIAIGQSTIASEPNSIATGWLTRAKGNSSSAEGYATLSYGSASHAEGNSGRIGAYFSGEANATEYITSSLLKIGFRIVNSLQDEKNDDFIYVVNTSIKEDGSFTATLNKTLSEDEAISNKIYLAIGNNAIGGASHVEGGLNAAVGTLSHAEGMLSIAIGSCSHAEGQGSTSQGSCSHSEGQGSIAIDYNSHAEGSSTRAVGSVAHTEGTYTIGLGKYSHSENNHTLAAGKNSHAENGSTAAYGEASHSEGKNTRVEITITGAANATQYNYTYNGTLYPNSIIYIEDYSAIITSVDSVNKIITVSPSLVKECNNTAASVYVGNASGLGSHVEGSHTIATGEFQHVQGKYNVADTGNTYADIVGGGTSLDNRRNIRTLDWNGNETLAGKLTVGSNPVNDMDVTTKEYVDDLPSEIVKISNTEPSSTNSRIWIQGSDEEYEIPTMDEVVQDVQINGQSIVSDGVANVPIASDSVYGLVKTASSPDIKAGLAGKAITARQQFRSVFYGLAESSGDTTQSASSNAVGTYTEEAKIAIQKMLGIYEAPWELIREDTFTNTTQATHNISVDGNGQPFELTSAILMFETPTQATQSKANGNLVLSDGSSFLTSMYTSAWTQEANATAHGCWIIAERKGDLVFISMKAQASSDASYGTSIMQGYGEGFQGMRQSIVESTNFIVRQVKIAQVLGTGHYKLYGKRKWQ